MNNRLLHFWGICLLLLPLAAFAHKPSDSYLFLQDQPNGQAGLRWDISLRDLEQAIGLDSDGDGKITWGELRRQQTVLDAYALSRLRVQQGETACQPKVTGLQSETHTDGGYAVLLMDAGCPANASGALQLQYSLLFDIDPTHRGILLDQRTGSGSASYIFSNERTTLEVSVQHMGWWQILGNYVREGVHHILTGFDHLLFITMLILPAVLVLKGRQWRQVESFRPALINLLKVITAFTVAHSITLSLAVLGVVDLPSRLVESAIALSIVVVAANVLYPVITHDHWKLAFAFGLLHGLGFASVLMDMQMPAGALAEALFGFNVGVELGQLLLVLTLFPLAFMLRPTRLYRVAVLNGAATITLLLAGTWLVERVFNTRLLSS